MNNDLQAIYFRDFKTAFIPHILKEMYIDKIYNPYFEGKKDLTILDIGANIGLFSFYTAEYAKKIYAVEPSQPHFDVMCKMLDTNKLTNVQPVKMAISDRVGMADFYHNTNTTMYSLKKEVENLPDEKELVQTADLATFFEMYSIDHVDVMKIDIEGSEGLVFASDGFEKVADKIDLILGEFHSWSGINPAQFANSIRDRGFEFEWQNLTQASTFVAKRI